MSHHVETPCRSAAWLGPGSDTTRRRDLPVSLRYTLRALYVSWYQVPLDLFPSMGEGYHVVKTRDRGAQSRGFAVRTRAALRTTPDPVSHRSSLPKGDGEETKRKIRSSPFTRNSKVWTNNATTTRYTRAALPHTSSQRRDIAMTNPSPDAPS